MTRTILPHQRYRSSARPPQMRRGQARRYVKQTPGMDVDEAIAAARKLPWWPAATAAKPVHTGEWWVFTVEIARLL